MPFPQVLLRDVLGYLDLEDLLRTAMPVDHYWRGTVIEHPTYWQSIEVDERLSNSMKTSISLFLVRLLRTGSKPVDLQITLADPRSILADVVSNISHIRDLHFVFSEIFADEVMGNLRQTAAPLLESLSLFLTRSDTLDDPTILPSDIFSFGAPVLMNVTLSGVELPRLSTSPACFSRVTSLCYIARENRGPFRRSNAENFFVVFPSLESLHLRGLIHLGHPAFREPRTWQALTNLSVEAGVVEPIFNLPLSSIPRIVFDRAQSYSAFDLCTIAERFILPGPLTVTLVRRQAVYCSDGTTTVPLDICLKGVEDVSDGRWIRGTLPPMNVPACYPRDHVTALQNPPLVDRIVSISIELSDWDLLVGKGYLTCFPALEDLILRLSDWFFGCDKTWGAPTPGSVMSCPRLRHLVLFHPEWVSEPCVYAVDVMSFAGGNLKDMTGKVELRLQRVTIAGPLGERLYIADGKGQTNCH